MKFLKYSLFSSLGYLTIVLLYLYPWHPSTDPLIQFKRWSFVDQFVCPKAAREKMESNWDEKLNQIWPHLETAWEAEGAKIISRASELIGKPYAFSSKTVGYFLCPGLPGWSLPPMVPAFFYFESSMVPKALPSDFWVSQVSHQIINLLVLRQLAPRFKTPLLEKYAQEHLYTRLQLHTFALEKSIYLGMQKQEAWNLVAAVMRQNTSKVSRIVEIVDTEGSGPFLEEIRR